MFKLIQFALACLILTALVVFVGSEKLWQVFLNVKLEYLLLLFFLSFVLIWASCIKWKLFIVENGNEVSLFYLMKIYIIGYFFNFFTPSMIGGDASRSYYLGKFLGNQSQAFVSTFLERLSGLFSMCFLAFVFVVFGFSGTEGIALAVYLLFALVLLLAFATISESYSKFFFKMIKDVARKIIPDKYNEKFLDVISKLDSSMSYARGNITLFTKAILYSLLFHFLTVINTYVACLAVGWESPDFLGLFVVVPLILLVSILPITPSGVGVQEGAFVFFLKRVGAESSQGLAVALILRAKVLLLAVIGGLLFFKLKKQGNHS